MNLSVQAAYEISSRIAAVWIIISAFEGLRTLSDYDAGGPFDARIIGIAGRRQGIDRRRTLGSRTTMGVLLILRLLAGLVLLTIPFVYIAMVAGWVTVAVTNLFLRWRRLFGDDGSDQMLTIVSVAFSITLLFSTTSEHLALGLYFVGAQAILSYVTAGVAKLVSHEWRTGAAIQGIFSTRTYGVKTVATAVRRSWLARPIAWATISFETSFVVAIVLPFPALLILLAIAAVFHVSSALVMGLNGFVWAFISTYPSIVYLNQEFRGLFF